MQVARTNLPKSRVQLDITVPVERMAVFFEHAVDELGKDIELSGFRKGKAPRAMLVSHLGENRIFATVLDHAIPESYQEALASEKLVPVVEPAVEVKKLARDETFNYVVEVDVLPEVRLPNYQKIRVDTRKFAAEPVKPEDLDAALLTVRRRFATPKPVLRPAQTGDWVEVSYSGKAGGVPQDGLTSQHHPLILGEGMFLPKFEEQILGMGQGEQRMFTIDVPQKGGAVKPIEFSATLDVVSELAIPEFDDELAKKYHKATAAELRQAVEDDLKLHHEETARTKLEQHVLTELAKGTRVDLPESLIEREINRRIEILTKQLERAGQKLEAWLGEHKKDLAGFRKELRDAAATAVITSLALRAVAEVEGLAKPGQPATEEGLKKTVDFLVAAATEK